MSGYRRRQQPEAEIQGALFQHYGLRGAPNTYLFHCPNGGSRNLLEAVNLKRLGVTPGVPDIVGVRDGRIYLLELKRPSGRLSDAQKTAHEQLRRAGAEVMTADSLDLALHQLEEWGLLRGKSRDGGARQMNAKEKQIERLLATAHQICWDLGRHDVCTPMISALNCLRRLSPRPLPDNRDEHERDLDEEAVANGTKSFPS